MQAINAMKQAKESLEYILGRDSDSDFLFMHECRDLKKAITDLDQAIKQEALQAMHDNARELGLGYEPATVQPVGVTTGCASHEGFFTVVFRSQQPIPDGTDLYTTPPAAQKPWVDLTGEEIMAAPENLIACIAYVRNKLREKNAAAQPAVQEHLPIAMKTHGAWDGLELLDDLPDGALLYTTPTANKPWVGLTDDLITEIWEMHPYFNDFARTVETKLKALNYPTGNYPIVDN
jgi:hypothetical protein